MEIDGIAPSWTGAPPIKKPNFTLLSIKIPNIASWRQIIFDILVALRLIRVGKKYDLIYIRLCSWHFAQILAIKIIKRPFVVELNGLTKEDSESGKRSGISAALINFQEKWLVQNSALCICVSDGIEREVNKRYRLKGETTTIQNGVAEQFFKIQRRSRNEPHQLTVIYVGTFTPWDGAREIVNLARQFPSLRFLIVGDGVARAEIQKHAPGNVVFLGQINYKKLPEIYKTADCGVVLYEFERHKNVKVSSLKTLEYVASQLPVFTTNINGQKYIEDEGFGALLHEEDNLEEQFSKFVKNIETYNENYLRKQQLLPGRYGWQFTAMKTIDEIRKLSPI